MTNRRPPRLALALLQWFVADSAPLAGDLIEDFEVRQSSAWFWWQVLVAIRFEWLAQPDIVRPLQLVDLQPCDAVERSRRLSRRFRSVNLTASPLYGIGGLGLVALSLLMTLVVPAVWAVMLASMLAGAGLGLIMIARRRDGLHSPAAHS